MTQVLPKKTSPAPGQRAAGAPTRLRPPLLLVPGLWRELGCLVNMQGASSSL